MKRKIDRQSYKRVKRTLNSTLIMWWVVLFAGLVFIAVGGGFAFGCRQLLNNVGFIIFYCVFLAVFFAVGLVGVIFALKQLIPYFIDLRTLKFGEAGNAVIIASRELHVQRGFRLTAGSTTFYSLTLRFGQDGEEKIYSTRYYYDEKQFGFLTHRNEVEIRYFNGRAVVVEEFPEFYRKFKDLPRKTQTLLIINLVWTLLSFGLMVCGIILSALQINVLPIVFVLTGMLSLVGSAIMKNFLNAELEKPKRTGNHRRKK